MEKYNKPLPKQTALTAPFWQAAREGRLELQYCNDCNSFQHYPKKFCSNCWSEKIQWRQCSGKGHIYSYGIFRISPFSGFEQDVPYVVAMVELEEGIKVTTNIIGCPVSDVYIDMPVEAFFDPVTQDCSLIKFQPANATN